MKINIELGDPDLGSVMTPQQWLVFIEELIAEWRKRHFPPSAINNLTAAFKRSNTMSTVTLNWTLPTTRVDGSPLATTDIDHVDIFDVSTADPASEKVATIPGAGTSFVLSGTFTVGIHNYTATVTDTAGNVSGPSNVATITVASTLAIPSPITDLTAVFA
jgi:hypothetical protein